MCSSDLGRFVPDFQIPPVIGIGIVHIAMQKNFTELVDEINRREAQARSTTTKKD